MPAEEFVSPVRTASLTLASALSIATALMAVGAVTLHVMGESSHRAYLQFWGVDAGAFPKSTDWLLINGYHGLANRSALALLAIVQNLGWWVAATVATALYLFVLLSPTGTSSGVLPKWLAKRPAWCQRLVRYLQGAFLATAIIPVVLLIWTAVLVSPALIGEANGKAHAEREAAEFKKGCETSKYPCVEVKKGGEALGSGFVLEGSPSYIAIFDVRLQRARVIPRDGVELISGKPIALPKP
ncbi:hypothetical protein ABID97_003044 [Variovorax sp. OAS795]|uniref:hypothetical protein n=1 Tax=Variovorax sp. OAS795 TaxID=3034231 RepID=UPI003397345B